jgi:shikimate kinase
VSHRTLALVGLRCSGKSTLGRLLARELDGSFVDLDDALLAEANAGAADLRYESVGELLLEVGQDAFRDLESRTLRSLLASDVPKVLATGGGAVERPANRALLRERAAVIWLRVDTPTLQARMRVHPVLRPPLLGDDPVAEIPDLARLREPHYREVADSVLDCGTDPPQQLLARILAAPLGFSALAPSPTNP